MYSTQLTMHSLLVPSRRLAQHRGGGGGGGSLVLLSYLSGRDICPNARLAIHKETIHHLLFAIGGCIQCGSFCKPPQVSLGYRAAGFPVWGVRILLENTLPSALNAMWVCLSFLFLFDCRFFSNAFLGGFEGKRKGQRANLGVP